MQPSSTTKPRARNSATASASRCGGSVCCSRSSALILIAQPLLKPPSVASAPACIIRKYERMRQDAEEDERAYKVVVNAEEQYSIWFADRENAPGWRDAG